jgi:hypothetical protein
MNANQLSGPGYGKRGQSLFPGRTWPGHGRGFLGREDNLDKKASERPSARLTFTRQLFLRV